MQYRALPASVRDRLSMRQQMALLPVDDTRTKRKLAEEALARGLSGEQITRRARDIQGTAESRGRPPLPALDRATRAALRLLQSGEVDAALVPAALRVLPEPSREAIRRTLVSLREMVERIGDAMARN